MNRHLSIAVSGTAVAIAIVLPLLVFALARAMNSDEIAPNVNAGGVEIGGLSEEDALTRLREHEAALRDRGAAFVVNGQPFELAGATIGLDVDEEEAVRLAMQARLDGGFLEQFASWVRSFSTPIDVSLDITIDDDALEAVLKSWEDRAIALPANQGGIEITDGVVMPVYPQAGEGIDRETAPMMVFESMRELERPVVTLPTARIVPQITRADVDAAVAEAETLIDGDVVLTATDPDIEVTIPATSIAEAVRSSVELDPGRLVLDLNPSVIAGIVEPQREVIEQPARNAEFRINGDETVDLLPSRRATLLDVQLVATAIRQAAAGPDRGTFPFRFGTEAEFTTEEAEAMEPISRMSAYSTDFPPGEPRVTNIHLIAEAVDGAIVWPGETFSLNDHVGPRTEEKGYVPAPMILRGEIVDDVGGGVSQFATTFYNAVFFGCYEDVEHQPHSFYFSRYPEGREATISWPTPDLVFRNDSDALVLIDTSYSDSRITVKFYGNNGGRDCDAELSDRYDIVEPEVEYVGDTGVNPGSEVRVQTGTDGWSVDVTRIMTMPDGEVVEQSWTHDYQARPMIIHVHPCEVPGSSTACPLRIPSVAGLTFAEATATLESAGFLIGDGGTVSVESESQNGLVQSQDPGAGSYAAAGSVIRVVVGVYEAPPPTTEPPPDTTTTTAPPPDG